MSLQQVAAATKISARVFESLERNDPSKLPGGIFSRAFVRAYAREVGLDPEETVKQFMAAFSPEGEVTTPATPSRTVDAENFESGRRTAVTLLQIAGLSILVVIVALVYVNLRPAPSVPTQPERDVISTPAATAAGAPTPKGELVPVTDESVAPSNQPTAAPSTAIPSGRPPTNAGAATSPASATEAPLVVSILATDACWLSLSVDGVKVMGRVLQPGERVEYQARAAVILSAGNAGALAVTINGKPGKPLGGPGQVVTRTITVESMTDFLR